jgi:curved DNA-binding protein CbpA
MLDYYKILEVKQDATKEEIKKKFRKLANIYHPDKNQNSLKATEYFKIVLNAYEVLNNDIKRKDYDVRYNDFYRPTISNYNETINQTESNKKDLKKFQSNKKVIIVVLIIVIIFYYFNSLKNEKVKKETHYKLEESEPKSKEKVDLDTLENIKQGRPNTGEIKF